MTGAKKPPGDSAQADTIPPMSGARRRSSAVQRVVAAPAPRRVAVVDRDPIFRLLVVALLEGCHRTHEAVDAHEAAYLWRIQMPDLVVARPSVAIALSRFLVDSVGGSPRSESPALIVVTAGGPVSLRYDGVAAAVHRSRFVDDLPQAITWALEARDGRS